MGKIEDSFDILLESIIMSDAYELITKAFDEYDIDEIGIIMTTPFEPDIIVVENKLGISQAVIKPLFKFLLVQFHNFYKASRKGKNVPLNNLESLRNITRVILIIKGDMSSNRMINEYMILNGFFNIQVICH